MIAILSAALLLAMGQTSAGDTLIERPTWIRTPTARQIEFAYPAAAKHAGAPVGVGTIACEIAKDGKLENCQVYKESPADLGFGEAALKLAKYFQMAPLSPTGKPVAGGTITVPIVFLSLIHI